MASWIYEASKLDRKSAVPGKLCSSQVWGSVWAGFWEAFLGVFCTILKSDIINIIFPKSKSRLYVEDIQKIAQTLILIKEGNIIWKESFEDLDTTWGKTLNTITVVVEKKTRTREEGAIKQLKEKK